MFLRFKIFYGILVYLSAFNNFVISNFGDLEFMENVCNDNENIISLIDIDLYRGYKIKIRQYLSNATEIGVQLDSAGTIFFGSPDHPKPDTARFTTEVDSINNIFNFILLEESTDFTFTVKGRYTPEHPPYVISLKINGEENCRVPNRTFFGENMYMVGTIDFWPGAPDKFCGRQRILSRYVDIITYKSAHGYWPWHSAIYRFTDTIPKYICSGTLISRVSVLTAAHCVSNEGLKINSENLQAILGKYDLNAIEKTAQDKNVEEVIVHHEFDYKTLANDMAILKLSSEARLNNYVQPACLWLDEAYEQMDSNETEGMVVGWSFAQNETRAASLLAVTPLTHITNCFEENYNFFNTTFDGTKFCSVYNKSTLANSIDSGGAFMVFVPDLKGEWFHEVVGVKAGAWYLKGVVSDSIDVNNNIITVFSDVSAYRNWILDKNKNDIESMSNTANKMADVFLTCIYIFIFVYFMTF